MMELLLTNLGGYGATFTDCSDFFYLILGVVDTQYHYHYLSLHCYYQSVVDRLIIAVQ